MSIMRWKLNDDGIRCVIGKQFEFEDRAHDVEYRHIGASLCVRSLFSLVYHSLMLYVPAGMITVTEPEVARLNVICVSVGML